MTVANPQHPSSRPQSAFEQRTSGGHHGGASNSGTSFPPGSARDTFLNYFFGQNGPGPIAGSSVDSASVVRAHPHAHSSHGAKPITPIGRDVSGGESALTSGLMSGKRVVENSSAAFDMKSLGKHIEAVSTACWNHVLFNFTKSPHC
jgi:dynamin 1-like protein